MGSTMKRDVSLTTDNTTGSGLGGCTSKCGPFGTWLIRVKFSGALQHSERGRCQVTASTLVRRPTGASGGMKCGNAIGEPALVCVRHAIRRTSLICNISKMILVTGKLRAAVELLGS